MLKLLMQKYHTYTSAQWPRKVTRINYAYFRLMKHWECGKSKSAWGCRLPCWCRAWLTSARPLPRPRPRVDVHVTLGLRPPARALAARAAAAAAPPPAAGGGAVLALARPELGLGAILYTLPQTCLNPPLRVLQKYFYRWRCCGEPETR